MTTVFRTIGLIGKHGDPSVRDTVLGVGRLLLERGLAVSLEEDTAALLPGHDLPTASIERIGAECDLAIVVGGDGSLLNAASRLCAFDIALLGINLGRLGFLADVSPGAELPATLDRILAGEYDDDRRFLLQAQLGETSYTALNDVVLHKWNIARMIEFETYIDGQFVNAQRSDGLVVSTPTGSTAYALSGGGPLLHPQLDAMILVPICPHTLSNRPIVVQGDSQIDIHVCGRTERDHVRVTCDGQVMLAPDGGRISIRKHHRPIRLIHPRDHDPFNLWRAKLGWSETPTSKAVC